MGGMRAIRALMMGVCIGVSLLTVGCGGTPGSDKDEASATTAAEPTADGQLAGGEEVTLRVVDTDNDPGAQKAINAAVDAFEAKYSNVTVERTGKNFDELMSTVGQLATSDDAPCVVHGSQGSTDMALVKAKAIIPLERWVKTYGWDKNFSAGQLATVRVADDGSSYGAGALYGIAPKAEVVGAFYNKKLLQQVGLSDLPSTWSEFEDSLAKAKAEGIIPIGLGLADYNMLPGLLFDRFMEPQDVREWVFGVQGATVETSEGMRALQTIADWAEKGYFYRDAVAVKDDDAVARFAQGKALYYFSGPWRNASIAGPLGSDAGFFTLPPEEEKGPARATGAISTPYHITTKCGHADVAAAYLGFLTSPEAAAILLENGDVPAVATDTSGTPPGSQRDILNALAAVSESDGLNPYKDWAAPGMSDTIIQVTQGLVSKRTTPAKGIAEIQATWTDR